MRRHEQVLSAIALVAAPCVVPAPVLAALHASVVDTSPLPTPAKLVFVHHSTGEAPGAGASPTASPT